MICSILAAMLSGCSFGDEPFVCPYNVRMEYWYAGSSTENTLPTYVDNLRQYLFDAKGNLLATITLKGDSVAGWNGNLPDGDYTLVLWGNLSDESNANETIQIQNENDMNMNEMTLSAQQTGIPPGYRGNTSRLYYGTTAFTLQNGATRRRRVYLSHAHAVLSVTVRWMTGEPPADGIFRMRLKGIPAVYGFTGGNEATIPSGDGQYIIPRITGGITYHETRAALSYDGEVIGEFVTFRYTASTHQLWSLWKDGEQIVKDLDLNLFFNKQSVNMDTNMEQEFDLLVSVYDDKIIVTQATASDWDEGGTIG
ncbi:MULTISPECIES: FimB/Mfa2 family fimbrial subunit [Parabacteroides]|nr:MULTISPECIES: FimB/Mfa2 family fimbrial subunit [Parabacteroides]DAL84729.1 MAG TPA: Fimbrillin-A associated anchor proteins Mfa1 and Mfa2 [Bacteriophage sp.]